MATIGRVILLLAVITVTFATGPDMKKSGSMSGPAPKSPAPAKPKPAPKPAPAPVHAPKPVLYQPPSSDKCNGKPYDSKTSICCNNKVYESKKWVCCDNRAQRRSYGPGTSCCGRDAYDKKVENCCDGNVEPGYGLKNKDGRCCGSKSYDRRCYACKSNSIVPTFDPRTKICCDGILQDMSGKQPTCCCGQKAFNPARKICCHGQIQDKDPVVPGDCCKCGFSEVDLGIVLDSSESISRDNWPRMLKFVMDILEDADIDSDKVRVGIISYRHDATLNMHLDDYHKKSDLFSAIQKIKYVPGSTNTGMGLEMMRTELFDEERGDRPKVKDVCLCVTDGKSDNGRYTAEQARLAREKGIEMFAIGIGLDDISELKRIASDPVNKHVFNRTDFTQLDDLKETLFKTVCTGKPVIPALEPCGTDTYDPDTQMCCRGKVQSMKGANTRCCYQSSYDPEKSICCRDKIRDKISANTVCCYDRAIDPAYQLCCENTPATKFSPNAKACCGDQAYDPVFEFCCGGYVQHAYGDPTTDSGCCGGLAYDKRCYDCVSGEIVSQFDPQYQICCDGVIQSMVYELNCCCGKKLFDPTYRICCEDKIINRTKAHKDRCCRCGSSIIDIGILADSSESIGTDNWKKLLKFIMDLIKKAKVDTGETRIGLATYRHNQTLEFYMNTYSRSAAMMSKVKKLKYVRGSTNTAGGLIMLHEQIFNADYGDRLGVPNFGIVITDGNSDDRASTFAQAAIARKKGIHMFVVGIGNVDQVELEGIASAPAKDNVFHVDNFDALKTLDTKLFQALSDVCPMVPRKLEKKKCPKSGKLYSPKTQVCCDGEPQSNVAGDYTKCCFKKSYDERKAICCEGNVDARSYGSRTDCCAKNAYDSKNYLCCDGTPLVKSGQGATECCGNETYDVRINMCCEDALQPAYGPKGEDGDCCLEKSYDKRCYACEKGHIVPLFDCAYQLCCDGKIVNFTSRFSCCCGQKVFNPKEYICCNGQIVPAIKMTTPCVVIGLAVFRLAKSIQAEIVFECQRMIADICFVLDSSESVGKRNWTKTERFVDDFIDSMDIDSGDIRIGIVTYRHNVSLAFPLNRYKTKAAMQIAVDALPYIPGSTNTGGGIEMMRTQIFKRQNGDRPTAPNFCIVVTDGDSDNPAYTIDQARQAKEAGIHMFAVGIGMTKERELIGIASPPAKDNYDIIDNFDMLKTIEPKILDYVRSGNDECPREPEEVCKEICGEYFMDPNTEICCHGIPQPRRAENNTLCCDKVSYDPDCYICCDDRLRNRYAGKYTKCCCHEAYDERREICCGNQILPRFYGTDTACCHNMSYDSVNQICCNGINIRPNFAAKHAECCGDNSYDTRCYKCEEKRAIPIFDSEIETCCEGNVSKKMYDKRSCCCGTVQFDPDTHICCNNTLLKRPDGPEVVCCGSSAMDPKVSICCDDTVQERMNGYETLCCGKKSYHPDKFHCCENTLSEKRSKQDDCCCNKVVFNVFQEICCHGKVQKLVVKGDKYSTSCCDQTAYDPKTQICCDGNVNDVYENGHTVCCGRQTYDPSRYVCDGKTLRLSGKCNGRPFFKDTQMCCNGVIHDVKEMNYTRCCHSKVYDIRKQVCCCGGWLQNAVAGIYTQCCYGHSYDQRRYLCCEGSVVKKPVPSADCCCWRQAYNSQREICCAGKVRSRCVGLFTKCCETEAYDPGYKICCDGKLHDRTYGHDTYCCGREIYTPKMAACCGRRIGYRKMMKMEW